MLSRRDGHGTAWAEAPNRPLSRDRLSRLRWVGGPPTPAFHFAVPHPSAAFPVRGSSVAPFCSSRGRRLSQRNLHTVSGCREYVVKDP